ENPGLHRTFRNLENRRYLWDRQPIDRKHYQRNPEFVRQTSHVLTQIHQCLPIKEARWVRRFEFLNRSVVVDRFEVREEDPAFESASQAAMMVDCYAHDDAGQPYPERTIAAKTFNAAIPAHQRFLNDVLRIGCIPRRSHRNLEQKGTVLPS